MVTSEELRGENGDITGLRGKMVISEGLRGENGDITGVEKSLPCEL